MLSDSTVNAIGDLLLFDSTKLLVQRAQVAVPVLGDHDQVLDPNAEPAGQVDAGLDRDDVTELEYVLRCLPEPRRLMHLDSHPVPEAVAELVLVAAVADHRAGGLVRVDAADAGTDRLQARGLRG